MQYTADTNIAVGRGLSIWRSGHRPSASRSQRSYQHSIKPGMPPWTTGGLEAAIHASTAENPQPRVPLHRGLQGDPRQKRKLGSQSMAHWNLDSRLLLKIFSMGTYSSARRLRVCSRSWLSGSGYPEVLSTLRTCMHIANTSTKTLQDL